MLSTWKMASALASGCTLVHKTAEWSPVTANPLVELMSAAGLPDGVVNIVHGFGEVAGKSLTEHPAIKAISFVGETATGSAIMVQGAATLKRVHFELGGKNPIIVFADADLDRALDAVFMIYSLNGECRTSSSRVLIEQSIYDEFVERLAKRAAAITCGHPLDPATWLGPLIHFRHFEKVTSFFDIARSDGAKILAGGKIPDSPPSPGYYVEATLFGDANSSMRIAREEIFGPVLTAVPFQDEAEALHIANDLDYGLNSVNTEINRQVDLRVLDLWQQGRLDEFLDMLPDFAVRCHGECAMIDTAMLFGLLGWKNYSGRGKVLGEYFDSSGTGQVNVLFDLPVR